MFTELIFEAVDADHETIALCLAGYADESIRFSDFTLYRYKRHVIGIRQDGRVCMQYDFSDEYDALRQFAALIPKKGSVK